MVRNRASTFPLRIDVGRIRLYFCGLDNDDVLRERAQAALPILEASLGSTPERTSARVRSDTVVIPAIEGPSCARAAQVVSLVSTPARTTASRRDAGDDDLPGREHPDHHTSVTLALALRWDAGWREAIVGPTRTRGVKRVPSTSAQDRKVRKA